MGGEPMRRVPIRGSTRGPTYSAFRWNCGRGQSSGFLHGSQDPLAPTRAIKGDRSGPITEEAGCAIALALSTIDGQRMVTIR